MPDTDLQSHLTSRLTATLTAGAPLRAPRAAQARYALEVPSPLSTSATWRGVTLGAAALAALMLVALAGPQQSRLWLLQSVGTIARDVSAPAGATVGPPRVSPGRAAIYPSAQRDVDKVDKHASIGSGQSQEPPDPVDQGESPSDKPAHGGGKPPDSDGNGSGGPPDNSGQGSSNSGHRS